MTTLLILAGADHPESKTRPAASMFAESFTGGWLDTVDLTHTHTLVPFVDGLPSNWPGATNDTVDFWIDALRSADEIVIAAPVYNFGIPAALKAWIDQVVIAGVTFDPETYKGLLPAGKTAHVFTASGASDPEQTPAHLPYLRQILSFIGIETVVHHPV